jgi:anti-sigma factor RsiW
LSDHLTSTVLNSLADGELSNDQLAIANRHLADCPQCTSTALTQSLLKSATARVGHRYAPPAHLQQRLAHLSKEESSRPKTAPTQSPAQPARGLSYLGWVAALAVLLISASLFFVQRNAQRNSPINSTLLTEVSDLHIATLAANAPPQVLSSDRHTVKPWFQGKIPFSFNLPTNLPADTTLDGANLTYLRNQPTAQLLFSIGKHRVSVFMQQTTAAPMPSRILADRSGFHVTEFQTGNLDVVAVSDVDPARLSNLTEIIEQAQTATQAPSK